MTGLTAQYGRIAKFSLLLILNICLIFVLISGLSAFNTENNAKIKFFEGQYEDLLAKAKAENKPFFVEFYTIWCGPCKQMDKFTFTDPTLIEYVDKNYVPYKVDAESLLGGGIELAQQFNIMFYPTIILFSPEGKVLKRLTGPQTAPELIKILRKFRHVKDAPKDVPVTKLPSNIRQFERNLANSDVFKVDITRQEASGYGVQIGVYADYANLLREVEKLDQGEKKSVLMNVNKKKDKAIYKLILGPFSSKDMAKGYKKNQKIDGSIVNLSKQ